MRNILENILESWDILEYSQRIYRRNEEYMREYSKLWDIWEYS